MGLAWDPFGNGKTAVRASFGTYYSLIDDLSFLLNSLPPANGAISLTNTALLSVIPVKPGVQPAPQCSATVLAPCTTFAPQGVQPDAKTPAVNEWNFTIEHQLDRNTSLRGGVCRVVRVSRICERRSERYSGADLRQRDVRFRRDAGNLQGQRGAGAAIHSGVGAAESVPGRRVLLVHRRQHQLQRSATRRDAAIGARLAVSRELYVVEGPRR